MVGVAGFREALADGLPTTYRRGRKAYEQARSEPGAESLHEWRKRSKDLWYELRLLGPVCGHSGTKAVAICVTSAMAGTGVGQSRRGT